MHQWGVSSEDVRAAIQATNANRPKGVIEGDGRRLQIYTPQPARRAADYRDLVIAWRNDAAVRLADVARGRSTAWRTGAPWACSTAQPAIIVLVTREPGANIIKTVDGVRALLPELRAQLPQDIEVQVASDRTNSIRASLREIEFTLMISIALVVLVVGLFLRSARATVIPAVATVVSLLGTFGVMYLLGFSPQQPEPDGAHRGHRLRGRRRHRRAGEHQPPHRGRHGPLRGGAARRARGRLHGAVDQPVAGGGVHPAAVHGRAGGAAVPRIRRHLVGGGADLAGHLAHHHADDVRLAAAEREEARSARRRLARARAGPRAATTWCCAATRAAWTGRWPARRW